MFKDLTDKINKYYPDVKLVEKDSSFFMKFLSLILFFNKNFMKFRTVIGNTIYVPKSDIEKIDAGKNVQIASILHEITHIEDANRIGKLKFSLLYLLPQLLVLTIVPVYFVFGLFYSLICLGFLLPLPAYFRMKYELRAYMLQLYCIQKMLDSGKIHGDISESLQLFKDEFTGNTYYYMWVFGVSSKLDSAMDKIKNGKRPFEDPIFDTIDKILA